MTIGKYIIVLSLMLVVLAGCNRTISQQEVEAAIETARYCDTENDCVRADSFCPFDCYVFVNEAEVNRINTLLNSFDSACTYSCTVLQGVDCINHKCTALAN
jgi:hypothetical protein